MTGLDTNILLRYFTQDDPKQSPRAARFLTSLTLEDPGWIAVTTIVELAWNLRSKHRARREAIADLFDQLLNLEIIVVERAEVVALAANIYRRGRADFADCLIAASARAAGCTKTVTFDRIAARDAGMELLD